MQATYIAYNFFSWKIDLLTDSYLDLGIFCVFLNKVGSLIYQYFPRGEVRSRHHSSRAHLHPVKLQHTVFMCLLRARRPERSKLFMRFVRGSSVQAPAAASSAIPCPIDPSPSRDRVRSPWYMYENHHILRLSTGRVKVSFLTELNRSQDELYSRALSRTEELIL